MLRKKNQLGFSLVELMIVVAIIGILSSIAVPNFMKFRRKAKRVEAKAALTAIFTAQKAFQAEYEVYYHNLKVIGFAPEGALTYHIGFGTPQGPNAASINGRHNTNFVDGLWQTRTLCSEPDIDCIDRSSGASTLPDVVRHTVGVNGRTFRAGAVGDIGGARTDHVDLDDRKTFTVWQDGTN